MYYHRKISVFKVLFLYFICHYLNVCCCFCNKNVEDNNQIKNTDIDKKHTTEDKNIEKDKDKEKDKEKKKKMSDIYKQI